MFVHTQIHTQPHTPMCLHTQSYHLIFFFSLSLTQKSRGLGARTKKKRERFLSEQAIGPGSFERVIIVKCQVNSEGLGSSNWEQISPDGDIFNTVLSGQSEAAGINQIPSLICLLRERSVSAHCFSFKICFFPFSFSLSLFLFIAVLCRKSGPFYQRIKYSTSKIQFVRVNFIHFQDHFYLVLSAEDIQGTRPRSVFYPQPSC